MSLRISYSLAIIFLLACSSAKGANLVQVASDGKISKKNAAKSCRHKTSIAQICESENEAVIEGDAVFDEALVRRLATKGVIASIDPESRRFNIHKGKVLIYCSKHVELSLGNADLKMAPNTMAYIYDNGLGTCAIMNLHDKHWNAMELRSGVQKLFVPPGREVIFTSWTKLNFDEANLTSGLWFRRVHEFKPLPTVKGYFTQYSLLSAAYIFPSIRKLANSDTTEGRKLVKTAAAVFIASGYPKDFHWKIGKDKQNSATVANAAAPANLTGSATAAAEAKAANPADARNLAVSTNTGGTAVLGSASLTTENNPKTGDKEKEADNADLKRPPRSGGSIASASQPNVEQKPAN